MANKHILDIISHPASLSLYLGSKHKSILHFEWIFYLYTIL